MGLYSESVEYLGESHGYPVNISFSGLVAEGEADAAGGGGFVVTHG